jgi:hypothetical protein
MKNLNGERMAIERNSGGSLAILCDFLKKLNGLTVCSERSIVEFLRSAFGDTAENPHHAQLCD